jgi:hypothetical protein
VEVADLRLLHLRQAVGALRAERKEDFDLETRDGSSGTSTRYLPGTRPNGYEYGDNFLPVVCTSIRPELRWLLNRYFFLPAGNPTGT